MSGGAQKAVATVVLAVVVWLPGCRKRQQTATPPTPVVIAATEPLSVPQTAVYLPPWQPIPPEAIPPEPQAEQIPAPPELTPTPPTQRPPLASPPRPRPPTTGAAVQTVNPPPPARTGPGAGAPLQPLLTQQQEQDLRRRIEGSLNAAQRALAQVRNAPQRRTEMDRVRSFVDQAQQARSQGDLERARSLAERAETLALDLVRNAR
jgi:hypothetical protein